MIDEFLEVFGENREGVFCRLSRVELGAFAKNGKTKVEICFSFENQSTPLVEFNNFTNLDGHALYNII